MGVRMTSRALRPQSVVTTIGTKQSITSRRSSVSAIVPTAASVQDPATLARMLHQMQTAGAKALSTVNSQHDAGGVLFPDVAFAAGQTINLTHHLGGAYKSWRPERIRGLGGQPFILEELAAQPDPKSTLALLATNAVLVDIYVWGG